jgi:hypothetical protein
MSRQTNAELTAARYSVVVERRQLTYVIEKDGNTLRINANPLYDFFKEMFTTDWKAELAGSGQPAHPSQGGL